MNDLNTAQQTVEKLELELERRQARVLELKTLSAEADDEMKTTWTSLHAARKEFDRLSREPSDRFELAEMMRRLRALIAAAPARSWTAKKATELLEDIERYPNRRTTAQALEAVTRSWRDFTMSVQVTDPQHGFNMGPEGRQSSRMRKGRGEPF